MAEKSTAVTTRGATGLEPLKKALSAESVKQQFDNALKENSGAFVASIIDLVGSDTNLQACDHAAIIRECLKAATLKLPINRQLGQAWVIPYKKGKDGPAIPQFQLGYRGYIQLAMRTGQYKSLNAGVIFEGINVDEDLLSGRVTLSGKPKNDHVQGYFAYLQLTSGFEKTVYMSIEEVKAHAKKYSRSYGSQGSAWTTDFDAMAIKTCLLKLLRTYGVLSIEMQKYVAMEVDDDFATEKSENANKEPIECQGKVVDTKECGGVGPSAESKPGQPEF